MKRTSQRLADNREIIYYDAADVGLRQAKDSRDISPVAVSSELAGTRCSACGSCTHRTAKTGHTCRRCRTARFAPPRTPGSTEVPEHDYEVVVFENRFPALAAPAPGTVAAEPPHGVLEEAPWRSLLAESPGAGRCEVVCYTSDHGAAFHELKPDRIDLVLDALIDRTRQLGARDDVEQVFCFENRGREIGVTQPHPHGQITLTPSSRLPLSVS